MHFNDLVKSKPEHFSKVDVYGETVQKNFKLQGKTSPQPSPSAPSPDAAPSTDAAPSPDAAPPPPPSLPSPEPTGPAQGPSDVKIAIDIRS